MNDEGTPYRKETAILSQEPGDRDRDAGRPAYGVHVTDDSLFSAVYAFGRANEGLRQMM